MQGAATGENAVNSCDCDYARVAKLADALDLGSSGATHGSSSLPSRTIQIGRILTVNTQRAGRVTWPAVPPFAPGVSARARPLGG